MTLPFSRCGGAWMVGGAVAAMALLWGTAAADAATGADPRPPSDPDALRLLRTASGAAQTTAFSGTEFLTSWSSGTPTTSQLTVAHTPGEGTVERRGGAKGGPGSIAYESDAPLESGRAAPAVDGLSAGMLDLLAANYSVMRIADGLACDRPAAVIEARRSDGSVAGRFWIDRETGVLLHRDLLDRRGRNLLSAGFQDFAVTQLPKNELRADRSEPRLMGSNASLWRTTSSAAVDGWHAPRRLAQRLSLLQARKADSDNAVQLVYSDGLSTVSVFVQHGRLDQRAMSGWRRVALGAASVFERDDQQRWATWGAGGRVYTVVADASQDTTDSVVTALPHHASGVGFWERLRRGGDRILSRINPFD